MAAKLRWRWPLPVRVRCLRSPVTVRRFFFGQSPTESTGFPHRRLLSVIAPGAAIAASAAAIASAATLTVICEEPAELVEDRDFAVFRRSSQEQVGSALCLSSPVASHSNLASLLADVCPEGEGLQNGDSPCVVLLGEVHDDGVTHKLQLQFLRHCHNVCREQGRRLVLSLEMFETDVQQVLDEYILRQAIREQDFLQDSRPWANYRQDYRPLVEFCREKGIKVIAANTPRRYTSLVARGGCRALQDLAQQRCATDSSYDKLPPLPLPPASAAYRQKFIETMASQMGPSTAQASADGCPFIGFRAEDVRNADPKMLEAQLLWDHSMAKSIADTLRGDELGHLTHPLAPRPLVLHICGAFHCAHGLGIPEAISRYASELSMVSNGSEHAWLPIDDEWPEAAPKSTMMGCHGADDVIGPKTSPPGLLSVVCWPASVCPTLDLVHSGRVPGPLGKMGDWVVITEETWGETQAG
eukprot:CAMPEP_0172831398 /NCGR_PEP_ID=MMETSP1075-20121228/22946_1 /TAXON_ID=2916 /ORGANISM="Ceratium fusus, Strain PA161109" /LENGTH=469 /DNA_ID=CAMNT_0013673863 /DNA_START=36 /DNA_END=1441 /DNA_ORIENTATION=-